ncbi:integral membrane protein PTH11 [Fusarium heterosporum]|uniref:Integral membrane protein PTH11 n=1 Tax=Fusarium heterosporum TaxID=42747 RepID=A0A8H5TS65_FUSHE|nr:integral membrane protein PTH11 [Fusarium heterosporum]
MGIEEQFILLALGLVTIGVRMSVRIRQIGFGGWQLDDYLMPFTGLLFTAETVAAYLVGAKFQGLTNSYMTVEERANINMNGQEHYNRVWGSKIQVIGWSFYACILWCLKFCVTAFYGRLTSGLTHLKTRVTVAYIILGVSYGVVALTILLSCQPFHHFWQVSPDPGLLCQPTKSPAYVLVVVIPNILTDIYLLSIPLPLLWGVNISLRRRLTLMLLFSGALFIIMAGTIRAVTILSAGPNGAVAGSQWACRETFVAIIVTNLPIIQPLIRKGASLLGLSVLLSRGTKSASQSHQLHSIGIGGSRFNNTRRQGPSSSHPLATVPQATAWASDEHILPEAVKPTETEGGIVVAQEISVQFEVTSEDDRGRRGAEGNDWGYKTSVSRSP